MFRESRKVGVLIPTVFVFGAGASKGAGIPLANEILPKIVFQYSDSLGKHASVVKDFLRNTGWRYQDKRDQLPTFEEVLSFLDLAIVRGEVFSRSFQKPQFEETRECLIYCLEAVLQIEKNKHHTGSSEYKDLVSLFVPRELPYATFITLNYDTLLDESLIGARSVEGHDEHVGADYCLMTTTGRFTLNSDEDNLDHLRLYDFAHSRSPVKLLKLHGSISWGFCPRCRMMVGPYKGAASQKLGGAQEKCPDHGIHLQTLIIPPSWGKDYRVHSIQSVWERARIKLLEAERVVFIGYSLPEADQEVRYLLKTGLYREDEPPPFIYVVDQEGRSEAEKRYQRFFGELEYQPIAFRGYLSHLKDASSATGVLGLTEEEKSKLDSYSSDTVPNQAKPAVKNVETK